MKTLIFHMCKREEWQTAIEKGLYAGSSQDQADGFIHFSTADQIIDSAAKHRAGQEGLLLLAVDIHMLGDNLKWEQSRGGALFPHLYGELPVSAATQVYELPLGPDGKHVFPDLG